MKPILLLIFLFLNCFDNYYSLNFQSLGKKERLQKFLEAVGAKENSCLASKEESLKILTEKYNMTINEKDINDNLRFIVGDCHPVILIPGIFSVRLKTQIDCKGLFNNEKDVFEKLQFFCLSNICPEPEIDKIQEYNLFLEIDGWLIWICKICGWK